MFAFSGVILQETPNPTFVNCAISSSINCILDGIRYLSMQRNPPTTFFLLPSPSAAFPLLL
jgi:hypothetical protein